MDSVAFSPSGQMLASTDVDDAMELWNVASPKRPQLLSQPTAPNTDEVFTSVLSPDSPVLRAGYDGAVRLWNIADPESPQPLGQPLSAGTGTVYSVAFSPDGTTLDSGRRRHGSDVVPSPDAYGRSGRPGGLGRVQLGWADHG